MPPALKARREAETKAKLPKSREPVVHSVEWTTSSLEKGGNRVKCLEKP